MSNTSDEPELPPETTLATMNSENLKTLDNEVEKQNQQLRQQARNLARGGASGSGGREGQIYGQGR